jgi:hypothetical protein
MRSSGKRDGHSETDACGRVAGFLSRHLPADLAVSQTPQWTLRHWALFGGTPVHHATHAWHAAYNVHDTAYPFYTACTCHVNIRLAPERAATLPLGVAAPSRLSARTATTDPCSPAAFAHECARIVNCALCAECRRVTAPCRAVRPAPRREADDRAAPVRGGAHLNPVPCAYRMTLHGGVVGTRSLRTRAQSTTRSDPA